MLLLVPLRAMVAILRAMEELPLLPTCSDPLGAMVAWLLLLLLRATGTRPPLRWLPRAWRATTEEPLWPLPLLPSLGTEVWVPLREVLLLGVPLPATGERPSTAPQGPDRAPSLAVTGDLPTTTDSLWTDARVSLP